MHIPDCPDKPNIKISGQHEYHINLITPMFGGGVSTRVNDPSFPIRPTSIRGQLQFWWRATVGAQYATSTELRAAQSAVWGDTTQASRVQVRVELVDKPSEPKVCAVIRHNHNNRLTVFWESPFKDTALPYALFPFQGKPLNNEGPQVDPASCIHKANFRLTVNYHKSIDFAKQVEPALWAWVNFGGLGSRTRRGCGAIYCQELTPNDVNDFRIKWDQHMPQEFSQREWPTLPKSGIVRTIEVPGDVFPVWDWLIGCFRDFRQGEELGRNPRQQGEKKPGRSRFPEPEAIRTVLYNNQAPWRHDRMTHIPNDAFPRAEFGLPIVFHFQGNNEPADTVLYPDNDAEGKKRDRMASPLILKPLALQNGKAIPLILRLKTADLAGVDLRIKRSDIQTLPNQLANEVHATMHANDKEGSLPLPQPTRLVDPLLSTYDKSPLQKSTRGSAIDAFLVYARSKGFTEVKR